MYGFLSDISKCFTFLTLRQLKTKQKLRVRVNKGHAIVSNMKKWKSLL